MTKKFWANWKTRCGETKAIWVWGNPNSIYTCKRIGTPNKRFISFEFSKDAVNIVYEAVNHVLGPNGGHNHVEISRIRLHRTEIKTIEF